MRNTIWLVPVLLFIGACTTNEVDVSVARKTAAERYIRGVYECASRFGVLAFVGTIPFLG